MSRNGTASRQSKGKTLHEKFSLYFDDDWAKSRSGVRTRATDERSYDPSYSWDGQSDNPKSFSRLNLTEMPVQKTRPITLSGAAVVPLDPITGLEVLNVHQPPAQLSQIPLTNIQTEVGMVGDLSGKIPMAETARNAGKNVLLEDRPTFKNYELRPPKFKTVEVPKFMEEAGPNCDQVLLTPAQRREILEYEKSKNAAALCLKEAVAQRERTRKQMAGQQFRRGVLMVDSMHNEESEIYGKQAKRLHADTEYKKQIHLERYGYLALRNSSMATNGNILVPETMATRVRTEPFYQTKGGSNHALSFDETHNRLFCRGAERAPSTVRTQKMRDCDLSGKQYNLINHTVIEHWPSRNFERLQDKRMAHPSQTSLEGSRNTQGALYQ